MEETTHLKVMATGGVLYRVLTLESSEITASVFCLVLSVLAAFGFIALWEGTMFAIREYEL